MDKAKIADRIAASHAKKPAKPEPVDNTDLVNAFRAQGGRVLHRPPLTRGGKGVTFAYKESNNRVELTTALTHTNDTFTKKQGTKTAIERFNAGNTIFLPLTTGYKRPIDLFCLLIKS